jgi:excisionase family DNA binding protein
MSDLADVNTVAETAAYLRQSENKVKEMARSRRLAGIKEGRTWTFTREAIRDYITRNSPVVVPTGSAPVAPVPPRRQGRTF